MAPGFIEGADGLIDLFAAHRALSFEAIGVSELAAGSLLGGDKVAEEDVAVC